VQYEREEGQQRDEGRKRVRERIEGGRQRGER